MSWQDELEQNIRSIEQLPNQASLSPEERSALADVIQRHPMSITRYYASLIDWNAPHDPLRSIAMPTGDELVATGMYDTSGESENTKEVGLQHKYSQTALVLATSQCTLYCRHCFRKRLVGLPTGEISSRFERAVAYIKEHPEINNVLISGGDPFILPTDLIDKLLTDLNEVKHLVFVRIGTRIPVSFPQRLTDDDKLVAVLGKHSHPNRRLSIVTHFDHPREITPQSTEAVSRLLESGIPVNNQTVLLKTVNTDPAVLAELQNRLVGIGVMPYYVFQCRPVSRVKHRFQTSLYEGYQIVEEAKKRLNGHSKRFRYAMSHITGKIEIVGVTERNMYFKYHQAKDPRDMGRFFAKRINKEAGWLDEFESEAVED